MASRKIINGRSHQVANIKPEGMRMEARNNIRVGQIIALLQKNAMGKLKYPAMHPKAGEQYFLSASQVKSAHILLDKAMPSLQAIDVTNHVETPSMTPAQLEMAMGQYLRTKSSAEIDRLRRGEPDLKVIEGEVV